MACRIHVHIDTPKACIECYESWPNGECGKYTRCQCKRHNWIGKADETHVNDKYKREELNPIRPGVAK